ncbi:MAG: Fic family protein [Prolixibacteraceae bacterium]|nr:Fic family protein [Prolixibacteraceae bacterium]
MNFNYDISDLLPVDGKLKEIRQLIQYDPLTAIVKERFQQEITGYLTSLKAKKEIPALKSDKFSNVEPEVLKISYQEAGREYAISQYLFDLAEHKITTKGILLLAELAFGESLFRQKEIFITNISGKRQNTPTAEAVGREMEELVDWYNIAGKENKIHPIARAAYLHYKFTIIHPFDDWNGRIARLMLNVGLMKSGYFPILIDADERQLYYETLEKADEGDINPLIKFVAQKELETMDNFIKSPEYSSIQTKFNLEKQLHGVGGNEKCIVLTEDSTTNNILSIILEASGFNMAETKMISYEGCSKISSANLFSIFVKEKMPNVRILVHRDRDYLTDFEINQQRDTFRRIDTYFFVTKGTDIESYLLNSMHVNYCHPSISEAVAQKLVQDARAEVYHKSVDYLRKKEFGTYKTEQYTHLNKAIENLVSENLQRFTHGKTAYKILQYKIQDAAREKSNLEQSSKFLFNKELNKIARSIWGNI